MQICTFLWDKKINLLEEQKLYETNIINVLLT